MKMLTTIEFTRMNLRDVAKFHGMKEVDFILEVFPTEKYIWSHQYFYKHYSDWYKRTQSKLAKALK